MHSVNVGDKNRKANNIIFVITSLFIAPLLFRLNFIRETSITHPTNMQVSIPTVGIKTFEVMKSEKSNKFIPSILMLAVQLSDKAQPPPTNISGTITSSVEQARVFPKYPITEDTEVSNRDIIAPSAAIEVSMKKMPMKICPKAIFENIIGIVTKSRDGPDSGAKSNANTAGKMAIPASMDTSRSAHMTFRAVRGIFWSSRK